METQNIVNLLIGSDNGNSKFATTKWCLIHRESKNNYLEDDPIKLLTKPIESSLCDYSDAYDLVKRNITSGGNDTKAAFKIFAPFRSCRTEINETFPDYADFINIAMPM